jgi:glutamate dehydrogenase
MTTADRPATPSILNKLRNRLRSSAAEITPWFLENMPEYYFRTHTLEEQLRHLQALISGQVLQERQTMTLSSPCNTRYTYISPAEPTALATMLERIVRFDIVNARFYTTLDGRLRLDTVLVSPQPRPDRRGAPFRKALAMMREYKLTPPLWPQDWTGDQEKSFANFLAGASEDYVHKFEPGRADRHFRLARMVERSEEVAIDLETPQEKCESRISLAMSDPPSHGLLFQAVKILGREGVTVHRGYADTFATSPDGSKRSIGITSFYVCFQDKPLEKDSELWNRLRQELSMLKWLFPKHALETFADEHRWPLKRVMLLQAAGEFAHQFLLKQNLWVFTSDNINRALLAHPRECEKVTDWFLTRFDPEREDATQAAAALEDDINICIESTGHEIARQALRCMFTFFRHTLRCNYFMPAPHGLCFRLDPAFLEQMTEDAEQERPYGIYFYHGPNAQGFHVRYREMSRGGMRVVSTRTQEQYELESNRLFDEVTGLAWAQQLKNKDIPEGGAKAVLLLGPYADLDLAVKGMVDSMLDLLLKGEQGRTLPQVRDYLDREEIIYLGPDEQITPEHITWMIDRAGNRGYPWPASFMSSKPGAGINHKEYGVTSLGVIVFAEEVLRHLGLDPEKAPFSVTFTGGPRGDVAGNAVKLLLGKYGANPRILTMADGHGCAFDPKGLDHRELMRLVRQELPITSFDTARLSGDGAFVAPADGPENVKRRNTLHNVVRADLFIPSGGRPETINAKNWQEFILPDGTPAAKAIVEGANIFISQEARDRLQERGVLVVHGSSANKTGVICSSYEILAGLALAEKEFMAVKKRFVEEVLAILERRARDEARLMLREFRGHGGKLPLTRITLELSREINAVTDALNAALCKEERPVVDDPDLAELYLSYCPRVLREKHREALLHNVPQRHQYALVAAHAASRIVYAEGVGWLQRLSQEHEVGDIARAYLRQEKQLTAFLAGLDRSRIQERDAIAHILRHTGRKFLTSEALGLI